jgi:hypothetical protein
MQRLKALVWLGCMILAACGPSGPFDRVDDGSLRYKIGNCEAVTGDPISNAKCRLLVITNTTKDETVELGQDRFKIEFAQGEAKRIDNLQVPSGQRDIKSSYTFRKDVNADLDLFFTADQGQVISAIRIGTARINKLTAPTFSAKASKEVYFAKTPALKVRFKLCNRPAATSPSVTCQPTFINLGSSPLSDDMKVADVEAVLPDSTAAKPLSMSLDAETNPGDTRTINISNIPRQLNLNFSLDVKYPKLQRLKLQWGAENELGELSDLEIPQ